jgi:hypothetical protein
MSRNRPVRVSNANSTIANTSARGSRMKVNPPTFGMGRGVRPSRSPHEQGRYETPEKVKGSAQKFYTSKKLNEFDAR